MAPVTDEGAGGGGSGTTPVAGNISSPRVSCLGKQGVRIWAHQTSGAGTINAATYQTSYDNGATWNAAGDDDAFVLVGSAALVGEPGGHAFLVMPAPIGGAFPPIMKCTDVKVVLGTTDVATVAFLTSTF